MNNIVNLIILILLIIVLLNLHNTLKAKETFGEENKFKCNYYEDTKPFPSGNLPGSYLVI